MHFQYVLKLNGGISLLEDRHYMNLWYWWAKWTDFIQKLRFLGTKFYAEWHR
jgi:hypothetical protein